MKKTSMGKIGHEISAGFTEEKTVLMVATVFETAVVRVLVMTVVIPASETFSASAAELGIPMAVAIMRR